MRLRVFAIILENPRVAELVKRSEDWALAGAIIPGYPTMHPLQEDFWSKFWKLYVQAKHPNAGDIKRPALNQES